MEWLRRYREEEGALPEARKAQMWRGVVEAAALGRPDVGSDRGELRSPQEPRGAVEIRSGAGVTPSRRRGTALAGLAAALIVAVALTLAVTGPTHDDGQVASRTSASTTAPAALPPPLDEVAARAAARTDPILGQGDAVYAHRVVIRQGPGSPDRLPAPTEIETWVGADGTGRRQTGTPGADPGNVTVETYTIPGGMPLGGWLAPREVAELPTDVSSLLSRLRELIGASATADPAVVARSMVEILAEAGVAPSARAALFRGLRQLGFRPVASRSGQGSTYRGPDGEGGALRVVIDEATTTPQLVETVGPDGVTETSSFSEVELRSSLG